MKGGFLMGKKIITLDKLKSLKKDNTTIVYHKDLKVEIPKNHIAVVIIPYLFRKKQISLDKDIMQEVQQQMMDYHLKKTLRKLQSLINDKEVIVGKIFAPYNYQESKAHQAFAYEILDYIDSEKLNKKKINFLEYGFDEGFVYLRDHNLIDQCQKNVINFVFMRKHENDWLKAILSKYSKKRGYILEHIPLLFIKIK